MGAETEEFSDDEAGEGPPGFEPLVVGGRGSKPTLLGSSACVSRNDDATGENLGLNYVRVSLIAAMSWNWNSLVKVE